MLTRVCRLRCPVCRRTPRLLPDEILPWRQYALSDIQAGCEAYVETDTSYRQAALSVSEGAVPALETLTTCWGGPEAPPLSPSTVFRWVDRFSRGAGAWWIILAAEAQARSPEAIRPGEPPEGQAAKARSAEKLRALKTAWHLLALLRWLLAFLGFGLRDWPRLLIQAPKKPRSLDHTGWFISTERACYRAPP